MSWSRRITYLQTAMQNPATTPLAVLEKYFKKKLV